MKRHLLKNHFGCALILFNLFFWTGQAQEVREVIRRTVSLKRATPYPPIRRATTAGFSTWLLG
ncbi:hypothetical protein [Spirosoma aerolatum]|uniref:hypothetical protein n=1 Tax=Spirosoma aerolatum TaxID=1211326 RepID=UPI0012D2CC72|nr:hypothetical protein [Spirosoma aerolatum]